MHPEKLSTNEFTIFKICHKMLRLGKDHEIVYAGMDTEGEGAVTYDQFMRGLAEQLDVWANEEELKDVFESLEGDGAGRVKREAFCEAFSMDAWSRNARNPLYMGSKSDFLTALTDVYQAQQKRDAGKLRLFYT
ncbi:MAG: hypothetical protein V2I33_18350 [Kangiellaceae bacterium]|nr:hypothetical protein [Kangiellaceae bacterium]